jgi:hypothetical protein
MRDIYFGELRLVVLEYIRQIDNSGPEPHSIAWFLLKYLRRIVRTAEPPARPGQVEGAVRSLVRFYVDNIDEKSDLGRICVNIYDQYRKVLRDNQSHDVTRD